MSARNTLEAKAKRRAERARHAAELEARNRRARDQQYLANIGATWLFLTGLMALGQHMPGAKP